MDFSAVYWFGDEIVTLAPGEWSDLPTDGVVSMTVHYGHRSMTLSGHDNYAVEGSQVFVWTDPYQEHASPHRTGQRYLFDGDSVVESEPINYIPELNPINVKRGVMLPDDLARQAGLID